MNKIPKTTSTSASQIRAQLDAKGYAIADIRNRENYLSICSELGEVTQTREIFLKPPETVEKFTGYSHLPDEVPFHTDNPRINVVGLFCERPDEIGGQNLLMDSRDILKDLKPFEIEALKNVRVPLPKSDHSLPILTEDDQRRPHIYWLPALALSDLNMRDDPHASSVKKFDQLVSDRKRTKKFLSFKLNAGQAVWFDNFVMLHGRDRLDVDSKRFQVRAFIQYREL